MFPNNKNSFSAKILSKNRVKTDTRALLWKANNITAIPRSEGSHKQNASRNTTRSTTQPPNEQMHTLNSCGIDNTQSEIDSCECVTCAESSKATEVWVSEHPTSKKKLRQSLRNSEQKIQSIKSSTSHLSFPH
jgi:hypothetical protein